MRNLWFACHIWIFLWLRMTVWWGEGPAAVLMVKQHLTMMKIAYYPFTCEVVGDWTSDFHLTRTLVLPRKLNSHLKAWGVRRWIPQCVRLSLYPAAKKQSWHRSSGNVKSTQDFHLNVCGGRLMVLGGIREAGSRGGAERQSEGDGVWRGKHHLAHCITSRACQGAKHVAKWRIYRLKMNFIATTKKWSPHSCCFICCQLMQCFLTASQHGSGKRIPADIKNIWTCQLMAWGIKILFSFSFFFLLHFPSLCLFEPKCLDCTLSACSRVLYSNGLCCCSLI